MTYSQQILNQTESYNNNLNTSFASIRQNYEVEVANAKREGEGLQALGTLASAVGKGLKQRKEYLEGQAKVKYYNAALDLYEKGEWEPVDPLDPETPEERRQRIKLVTDEIREGMPVEWGEKFLGLGEFQERRVQEAFIKAETAQLGDTLRQIIRDKEYDVSDEAGIAGSVAAAKTEWTQTRLMGFDEDLVLNNVPNVFKETQKVKQAYTKENNLRRSLRLENQFLVEIQYGDKTWGELYDLGSLTYDPKTGKPRTPGQWNSWVDKSLRQIADQGGWTKQLRDKYTAYKPDWGGGKTLGVLKEGFVRELDTQQSKALVEQAGNKDRARQLAALQTANQDYGEYEELVKNGQRPDDDWVALKMRNYKTEHGEADLALYNRMFTENEIKEGEAKRVLDDVFNKNQFIPKDHPALKYLSMESLNTYKGALVDPQDVEIISKNTSSAENIFNAALNVKYKLDGALPGVLNDAGLYIKGQALKRYKEKRNQLFYNGKALSWETAHDMALKEIAKDLRDNPDEFGNLYGATGAAPTEDRRFVSNVVRWISNNPNRLPKLGEIKVPQNVIDDINQFNAGRLKEVPDLVQSIQQRIPGKTYFDVMEALVSAGPTTESLKMPVPVEAQRTIRSLWPMGLEWNRKLQYSSPQNSDQAAIEIGTFPDINYGSHEVLHAALQPSVEDKMFISIGINEGTRTNDGGYTDAWSGHTDPGDGAANRGTISAREGTPEEADATWRKILSDTRNQYRGQLENFGIPVGSQEYQVLMFNIVDLRVQAPAAVPDFVRQIPAILELGVSANTIGEARAQAYINPATGNLEASGFNNDYQRLLADQISRSMTVVTGQRG